jgi:hypothetical protein
VSVLYVRLEDGLCEEVKQVAAGMGLSARALIEAILCDQLGRRHQLTPSVRAALREHRRAGD